MMYRSELERFEELERRVTILEGHPDPGLVCRTCGGKRLLLNWEWLLKTPCTDCDENGRVYPSLTGGES